MASRFSSLAYSSFRYYVLAQFVSQIGSFMQAAAQAWLVLTLFPDNKAEGILSLGVVTALQFVPYMLLGLFAGVVADRVSRRRILFLTQGGLMLTATALGLAVSFDMVSVALVAAISLCTGLAYAFDLTARESLVANLVPKDALSNAVALNALAYNLGAVLGPALFGLLAPVTGLAALFYLNAASFLGLIWVLTRLSVPPLETRTSSFVEDIKEGLRYVWAVRSVRSTMVLLIIASLTLTNSRVIIPAFADAALGVDARGFGLLGAAFSVGSILGAIWYAARRHRSTATLQMVSAALLAGMLVLLALAPTLLSASFALGLAGAFAVVFKVSNESSIQLHVPDALRGRVVSVYFFLGSGSAPLSSLLIAGAMGWVGPRLGLLLVALLALVAIGVQHVVKRAVSDFRT